MDEVPGPAVVLGLPALGAEPSPRASLHVTVAAVRSKPIRPLPQSRAIALDLRQTSAVHPVTAPELDPLLTILCKVEAHWTLQSEGKAFLLCCDTLFRTLS